MCNFCNKPKSKQNHKNDPPHKNNSIADEFEAVIIGNIIHVEYDAYSCDSSFSEKIEINYCPMCGRKLNPI